MSFRGGSRGGRGGGGGFGGGGFRGGSRGGGRGGYQQRDFGPPESVMEMGKFLHACEGEMFCESINPKVPQFNAQIFLENKTAIGKVDEVLGPINQVFFTVKPSEGIQAVAFKEGDKFYIAPDRTLQLERFLPRPQAPGGAPKPKRAGGGGGFGGRGGRGGMSRGGRGGGFSRGGRGMPMRGGRGGSFGGRGGSRGSGSGGFSRGGNRGRGGFSRGRG